MQFTKSEDYALLLIENLNHQVFMQFILPVGLKYGKIELRNKDQFERMDSVVRSTLHSFKVDMVNIYGIKDLVAYSYSKDLIGIEKYRRHQFSKGAQGRTDLQAGSDRQFLAAFLWASPKRSKSSHSPLCAPKKPLSPMAGPVLGVVEIVQDLSNDYESIFRYQVMTLVTVSGVMLILFLIMIIVVKRGESIIQKRAQERLKLKEQLSRAKHLSSLGEMVAGVSHEIRNPLGIISSSAELLKKKMPAGDASSRIPDIIIEESTRLNNIITDFLNFARPREPNRFPCRIEAVIAKNIDFLSPQIENNGYTIRTQYDRNLPEIQADADMLYQAFLNILINAMQAMPDGGTIDIAAKSDERSLWIAFEDQGGGVSPKAREKIWDPFFTTKDKGTGLGLGIVKNIIETHEGQIRLENRSEGGTRVSIRLPVDKKE